MQFSEALSYGVLAGTSIYCICQTPIHDHPLDIIAYASTGTTAAIALLETQFSNELIDTLRQWAEFSETFFMYPCLVANLWMKYGEQLYFVYAHPIVTLVLQFVGSDALNYDHTQIMAIGYALNETSCLYISSIKQNMYAIMATVVFFCTELIVLFENDLSLPPAESVNFGLAAVQLLFLHAFQNTGKVTPISQNFSLSCDLYQNSKMGFSEALSYGVLAGTSIFCIVNTPMHNHPLEIIAYGVTATTALISLAESQNSNETMEDLKDWAEFCETFTYPLLVGNLWLRYGWELHIGYAHPLLMIILKVIGSDALDLDPSMMLVIGYTINEASCAYLANLKQNMHALAGTVVFLLTELFLAFKPDISIPQTEMVNYGLSGTILLFFYAFKHVSL